MHFKKETDIPQNLIDELFFLTLTVRGPFHRNTLSEKGMGVQDYFLKKTEVLYAELNKTAEAALILQQAIFTPYIYFVIMAKNHQKIRSRCLDHEFSFKDIFKDIRHGYKAA